MAKRKLLPIEEQEAEFQAKLDKIIEKLRNKTPEELEGDKIRLEEFRQQAALERKTKEKEFYRNPDQYLRLDEVGDLHMQWFFDKYVYLRLQQFIPLFERTYQLLTERKCYSRQTAFGEMHCDGYLWIVKTRQKTVHAIVEQRQSFKCIYIYDTRRNSFHIRQLYYEYAYPVYEKTRLKGITINKFREQDCRPFCPNDVTAPRFKAFTYGDRRDEGYILSTEIAGDRIDCADYKSLTFLKNMMFWEYYVDHPDELE